MKRPRFSRRDVLKGSSALAARRVFRRRCRRAAPPATAITPAADRGRARRKARSSTTPRSTCRWPRRSPRRSRRNIPGIAVRVERTGAERVFQRIGQEYASRIHAVDVVNSSDAAHFIVWKREGILAALRAGGRGQVLSGRAQGCRRPVRQLPRLALRHRLQHQSGEGGGRAEELRRPARSEMEGQDRQGASGLQRHHHDRDLPDAARSRLGAIFEKLAKQKVMQVQSSADPPKKLALGERAVQADGNEYNMFQIKEKGSPVEIGLCRPKARR